MGINRKWKTPARAFRPTTFPNLRRWDRNPDGPRDVPTEEPPNHRALCLGGRRAGDVTHCRCAPFVLLS